MAWPDWVIASELATRLGVDLGFSSLDDIWAEITRISPLHQGVTYEALAGSNARDGLVVPDGSGPDAIPVQPATPRPDGRPRDLLRRAAHGGPHGHAPRRRLDGPRTRRRHPLAGCSRVVHRGAGRPDVGQRKSGRTRGAPPAAMPARLALPSAPAGGRRDPGGNEQALRLVARRTLWDAGTQVQAVPALAGLHPAARVVVHPSVLAATGTAEGEAGPRHLGTGIAPAGRVRRSGSAPWNGAGAVEPPGGPCRRSDRRFGPVHRSRRRAEKGEGAMGDPVFDHGLNLAVWIILLVKVVAVFAIVLVSVLFMVMYERKAVAWLGVRYGPNRAGPNGWLQSLADGTKLLFKEAFTPRGADKAVYKIAPYLMLVPALLVFAIVPIGGTITVAGHVTRLQLADPPWGILFLLMMSGISVYGVMLAGWASGSKYPLLGSVRASAQLVSYEAVLGLTTTTVVLVTGSLRTSAIVASQHGGFLNHWNFLRTLLIPFVLFAIAITAEMTRPPFDLVEAEEELSGGYNLEYSSIDFAWFYLAEYAALVTNSAIIVTLWFGGPDGPAIAGQQHRADLVHDQGAHHPVHLRLDPGHPAPPALRPADGSGLEAAHSGVAGHADDRRRAPDQLRLGSGRLRSQSAPVRGAAAGHRHRPGRHHGGERPATSA